MTARVARRYVQGATLRAFALVALVLTGLFSLLQFVEELAFVGQDHYRIGDALLYVGLTAPTRLLEVAPVSLLLGSLLALGPLARRSELTAMLSLGISRERIIGAVLLLAIPILAALLLLAELVVPAAQQLAQADRAAALQSASSFHTDNTLWAQNGDQYLNVREFGRGNMPVGVAIYEFAPDGSLRRAIEADRARIRPDGSWLLIGVTARTVGAFRISVDRRPTLPWHSFLPVRQVRFLILPLESVPPIALLRYVLRTEHAGGHAERYVRELWARIAIPFSMVAMVLIAAPFAFGPARTGTAGQLIGRGVAIGLMFSLAQQITGRLGLLLDLSPAVTALLPPVVVIGLAVHLLHRRRSGE